MVRMGIAPAMLFQMPRVARRNRTRFLRPHDVHGTVALQRQAAFAGHSARLASSGLVKMARWDASLPIRWTQQFWTGNM